MDQSQMIMQLILTPETQNTLSRSIKAKEAERDTIVSELRERHGTTYSAVQYRLWAEMKMDHMWDSLEKHPPYSMCGEKRHKGHSTSGELNEALTSLAKSIVARNQTLAV